MRATILVSPSRFFLAFILSTVLPMTLGCGGGGATVDLGGGDLSTSVKRGDGGASGDGSSTVGDGATGGELGVACGGSGQPCCAGACNGGFSCLAGICSVPAGDTGMACTRNGDCSSGICLPIGNKNVCTAPCAATSACVPGWTCAAFAGQTSNICQCTISDERCDGVDNDCDGLVDDASNICSTGPHATAAACTAGKCAFTCAAGYGDCDGQPQNGCEANLGSDANNCSACGHACGGACTQGLCATGAGCSNGMLDGNETATDCGGGDCAPCKTGQDCLHARDCQSGVCTNTICAGATCTDGIQDQMESAVDCGGPNCSPCAIGSTCVLSTDCQSGACTNGICAKVASGCTDGVQDGNETDKDCGGGCPACKNGLACLHPTDCQSALCSNNVCAGGTTSNGCSDGVKDNLETAVDCGGGTCTPCKNGATCLRSTDCQSNLCSNNLCVAASNGCTDGVRDNLESDIDCGGGTCNPCEDGQRCNSSNDCLFGDCVGSVCGGSVTTVDMTMSGGLTGCNGEVQCANNCLPGDTTCGDNCATGTTSQGQQYFINLLNCIATACPDTAGAVCDPNATDTTACSDCYQSSQESGGACFSQITTCINNLP